MKINKFERSKKYEKSNNRNRKLKIKFTIKERKKYRNYIQ